MNLEKFTSLLAGIIIPRENDKALSGSDVEFYKFMKKDDFQNNYVIVFLLLKSNFLFVHLHF